MIKPQHINEDGLPVLNWEHNEDGLPIIPPKKKEETGNIFSMVGSGLSNGLDSEKQIKIENKPTTDPVQEALIHHQQKLFELEHAPNIGTLERFQGISQTKKQIEQLKNPFEGDIQAAQKYSTEGTGLTKKKADETLQDIAHVNTAIAASPTMEDAAVNYFKTKTDETGRQANFLDKDVPKIVQGEWVDRFIHSPNVLAMAQHDEGLKQKLIETENTLYDKFPEYGLKVVKQKLGQERENKGMNSLLANNPSVENTEKLAKEMLDKGKLTPKEYDIWSTTLKPVLEAAHKLGAGNQVIPTSDIMQSLSGGVEEGFGGMLSTLKHIAAISDTKRQQQLTRDAIIKEYSDLGVRPSSEVGKLLNTSAHLTGFLAPMLLGNVAGVPNLATNTLMFMGTNADNAARMFPGNKDKQAGYTALTTGADVLLGEYLPGGSKVKGELNGEIKNIINKFTNKEISADVAKKTFIDAVTNKLAKVGKGNLQTGGVVTGFQVVHNAADAAFGGRDLDAFDIAKQAMEDAPLNFLAATPLSLAHGVGRNKSLNGEVIRQTIENPNTEELVKEKNNPEITQNYQTAKEAWNEIKDLDIKDEDKGNYLLKDLQQKVFEQKAKDSKVSVNKEKWEKLAKEAEIEKSVIYNPETTNTKVVQEFFENDLLGKSSKENLSIRDEKGKPTDKFDESKVGEYLKEAAQRINNLDSDWKPNTLGNSSQSARESYPKAIQEIAEKRWAKEIEAAQPKEEQPLTQKTETLPASGSTEGGAEPNLGVSEKGVTLPTDEGQVQNIAPKEDKGTSDNLQPTVKESPEKLSKQFKRVSDNQDFVDPYDTVLHHFGSGGKINKSAIDKIFGGKDKRINMSASTEGERRARISLIGKDAPTIEQLAHQLWESDQTGKFTTQDYKDAIERVLIEHNSTTSMQRDLVDRYDWEAAYEKHKLQQGGQQDIDVVEKMSEEEINHLLQLDAENNPDIEKFYDEILAKNETPDTKGGESQVISEQPKEKSGTESQSSENIPPTEPPPQKPAEPVGEEGNTVGVRHESLKNIAERMGLKQPERGTFLSPAEQTERGRKLLEGGADPQKVADEFKQEGKVSPDMISVARAHWMNLVKDAQTALDNFGKNSKEFAEAKDKMQKWQDEVLKPMGTASGASFSALQGENDLDTGSFIAVSNALKNTTGNEPNKQQEAKITELTTKNQELQKQAADLEAKVIDLTDQLLNAEKDKPTSIKDKAKKAANVIRKLKTARPDTFSAATPASLVWDAAVEIVASVVEAGGSVVDAVAKGIEHIRSSDWHKGLSNEEKIKAEQDFNDALLKPDIDELGGLQKQFAGKKDNKFTPDEAKAIWDYGKKNYIDKGISYRDMIKSVKEDLGLSWKQVSAAITSPKMKPISDAMWKKQGEVRRAQNVTKQWIDQQSRSIYVRAFLKASAAIRGLQVFGHAGVFMGTHAGMTLAQPRTWKYTIPAFFRAYKFAYGNEAAYERSLEELKSRPLYTRFERLGLKNNPDQVNAEEFQKSQTALGGAIKKIGLQGIKGFNALKVLRQDLAEFHYNKLSEAEKQDDESVKQIMRLVNNATGATNLKLPEVINEITFAGGMEAARWGKLTRNPMRATAIAIKAMVHPEKATTAEKVFAKVWASRVGEQLATYASLLAANAAIQNVVNPSNPTNILHPNKKDWLRPKFGSITIDPTSGMISTIDFIHNMGKIPFENKKELHGDTKSQAFGKALIGRARGKLAPAYSMLYDMVTQTDYNGNQLPLSNIKPDAQHRNIGWMEYATQRLPIPVAEGLHEMFQSAADNGTSPTETSNIMQALLLAGISGTTGARAAESAKEKPSPYTEEDKKRPVFKKVLEDWKMELPNTSPSSEEIIDTEKGTEKKLSDYPKETQDKYLKLHNDKLEENLNEIFSNGVVYVQTYKDAKGDKVSHVFLNQPDKGDYDEKPINKLSKDEKAKVLHLAQSQATSKTKKELFGEQ